MSHVVACPSCQAKLKIEPRHFGQSIACPKCAHKFQVAVPVAKPIPAPPVIRQPPAPPAGTLPPLQNPATNEFAAPIQNQNAYAPPAYSSTAGHPRRGPRFNIPRKDKEKAEAVILEAERVVFGIAISLFCTLIGSAIIGPWYLMRVLQWNGLSKKYPALLDSNAELGSLPARFQGVRQKLLIGCVVGCVMTGIFGALMLVGIAGGIAGG